MVLETMVTKLYLFFFLNCSKLTLPGNLPYGNGGTLLAAVSSSTFAGNGLQKLVTNSVNRRVRTEQ